MNIDEAVKLGRITGDVSGITGYVSNIWGNVSYIRGDVSYIRGDVSDIMGDVSGITGDVSDIMGDVSDIMGDVSGITGDVSNITGNVSGLKGRILFIFSAYGLNAISDGKRIRVGCQLHSHAWWRRNWRKVANTPSRRKFARLALRLISKGGKHD